MTDITNILRNPLGMPEIELAAARHWGADEIESLRTQLANLRWDLATAKDALANARADIHSCGPTCTRAGCVNVRLQADVLMLREALGSSVHAMRAPLDDWKGEVERMALDFANDVLEKTGEKT